MQPFCNPEAVKYRFPLLCRKVAAVRKGNSEADEEFADLDHVLEGARDMDEENSERDRSCSVPLDRARAGAAAASAKKREGSSSR
jgi:hypothetical protein